MCKISLEEAVKKQCNTEILEETCEKVYRMDNIIAEAKKKKKKIKFKGGGGGDISTTAIIIIVVIILVILTLYLLWKYRDKIFPDGE